MHPRYYPPATCGNQCLEGVDHVGIFITRHRHMATVDYIVRRPCAPALMNWTMSGRRGSLSTLPTPLRVSLRVTVSYPECLSVSGCCRTLAEVPPLTFSPDPCSLASIVVFHQGVVTTPLSSCCSSYQDHEEGHRQPCLCPPLAPHQRPAVQSLTDVDTAVAM